MTQHDDPCIQGIPLSQWEWYLRDLSATSPTGPPLRGIRMEPNDRGEKTVWLTDLPTDPWLGIHHSGPRMGARITMADLGWLHDEQRGREGV